MDICRSVEKSTMEKRTSYSIELSSRRRSLLGQVGTRTRSHIGRSRSVTKKTFKATRDPLRLSK